MYTRPRPCKTRCVHTVRIFAAYEVHNRPARHAARTQYPVRTSQGRPLACSPTSQALARVFTTWAEVDDAVFLASTVTGFSFR